MWEGEGEGDMILSESSTYDITVRSEIKLRILLSGDSLVLILYAYGRG